MDLDKEIIQIQKSTRTLFKIFTPVHNWLRLRSRFYYFWSIKPYSRAIHWIILLLYILTLPTYLFFHGDGSSRSITGPAYIKAEGATCSAPKWTWENPIPTGNVIYDSTYIMDSEQTDVFAVGARGTILHYNGTEWKTHYSEVTNTLHGISAYDHYNIWAVGDGGKIIKYNGSSWTLQASNTTSNLRAVIVIDSTTVWAVGLGGTILKTVDGGLHWVSQSISSLNNKDLYTIAAHKDSMTVGGIYNGNSVVASSNDGGSSWEATTVLGGAIFYKIKYFNDDILYAATSTAVQKSTDKGSHWSRNSLPAGNFQSIEIDSNNNVWAGGLDDDPVTDGILQKYDGSSWSDVKPDGLLANYSILTDYQANKGLFFGADIRKASIPVEGSIDWSAVSSYPFSNLDINAMSVDQESGNIWTVGERENIIVNTPPKILHYNGDVWSSETLGSPKYKYTSLNDVDAYDLNTIWAVGDLVGDSLNAPNAPLWKRNSSTGAWESKEKLSAEISEMQNSLLAVSVSAEQTVWAAGENGTIVQSTNNGGTWTSKNSTGIAVDFKDIYASRATETVWAIGELGTIILSTDGGDNWENQTDRSGTTENLNSIFVVDNNNAWVVGDGGVIRRTTNGGLTWTVIDSGTTANLNNVYVLDQNTVYIAGDAASGMSVIIKVTLNGESANSEIVSNSGSVNLNAIYADTAGANTNLLAVGANGSIMKYSPGLSTATKLLLALPGQKFASGISDVLSPETVGLTVKAGVPMDVNIYAVDDANALDRTNGSTIGFRSTDPNDANPPEIILGNTGECGKGLNSFIFHTPGTWTIYADDTLGVLSSASSIGSTITVIPGIEKKTYVTPPTDTSLNIGEASRETKIGLKDEFSNITSADSAHTITLQTSSGGGRFAPTAQGPWTNTLDLNISSGSSDISFYYLDYAIGTPTITVSSSGLESATTNFSINQDQSNRVNPLISGGSIVEVSANRLPVGSQAQIRATLKDLSGSVAEGKTLKFYSSKRSDSVRNPISASDNNGIASGSISSGQVGRSIISTYDETDNLWLESQPSIEFYLVAEEAPVELQVISTTLSKISTDKQKLVIGNDRANVTVTLLDSNSKPIGNMPVVLNFDHQLASSEPSFRNTNSDGEARFVIIPTKKGRISIIASINQTSLSDKVIIEIEDPSILESLVDSLKSDTAKKIANVVAPIVATTATLGLLPLIAGFVGSAPAALHGVAYGISLALEALGIRRRRKSWGRVYNSATGKGLDMALVRLYDQNTMKLVGTIITDPKGRYNFQPQPGTYVISVNKDGYIYPTQMFAKYGLSKINKNASRTNSHYLGQPINISSSEEFLNLDIPIDQMEEKATLFLRAKIWSEAIIDIITHGLSRALIPILAIGMILSVFVQLVQPSLKNYLLAFLYSIISLIYTISRMIKASHFSTIINLETGKPIPEVFVSIFEKQHDTLKESRMTDKFGRFSIFSQPGTYYIKAEKSGYEFDPKLLKIKHINRKPFSKEYWGEPINVNTAGFVRVKILGLKKE